MLNGKTPLVIEEWYPPTLGNVFAAICNYSLGGSTSLSTPSQMSTTRHLALRHLVMTRLLCIRPNIHPLLPHKMHLLYVTMLSEGPRRTLTALIINQPLGSLHTENLYDGFLTTDATCLCYRCYIRPQHGKEDLSLPQPLYSQI